MAADWAPDATAPSAAPTAIEWKTRGDGVVTLEIETPLATASVSLFGGQVLTWQPRETAQPVLWLSERARFDGKVAIRGGAPVCWPWFGAHPEAGTNPAHGYARLSPWRVDRLSTEADGTVSLIISLQTGAARNAPALGLTQTIRIGRALEIFLDTSNTGTTAQRYTEGLHTYFNVSSIDRVRVLGLEGESYLDLTAGNARRTQAGPIEFSGELGRLFIDTGAACVLEDLGFGRRIRIEKFNSLSTAVWNPGPAVAEKMADLGPVNWRTMVCVETANAADNSVTVPPAGRRIMGTRYTLEPGPLEKRA